MSDFFLYVQSVGYPQETDGKCRLQICTIKLNNSVANLVKIVIVKLTDLCVSMIKI